jgi:uncharacterized protein
MKTPHDLRSDPRPATPVSIADGGFLADHRRHNVYAPADYLDERRAQGAIHLRDGQRAARVTEDFIVGLHEGIEHEIEDASTLAMYQCGKEWALQDMKRFNERMRHEFGGGKLDIWQMKLRFVMESWWWPLTVQGWGGWTLDLSFQDKKVTFVEIRNSAVAQSMEQVGKPVCHLYAGMFAGVFSYYQRNACEAIEVQCYSMGNDRCKFMIGEEKQVNAAEFWRQEGASAADIAAKL